MKSVWEQLMQLLLSDRAFLCLPAFPCCCHCRMLKYSPDHMHCLATVWGPLAPPNTGVLAVQKLAGGQRNWRVAATGVVLQLDAAVRVMKKLKLVGTPFQVRGGGVGWGRGGGGPEQGGARPRVQREPVSELVCT